MNINFNFNAKRFNLTYSAFLIAGCIFKMAFGTFFPFYLTYFFYFFVFINLIFHFKVKTALLRRAPFFWFAVIDFLLVILFNFQNDVSLKIIIGDAFNILWWTIFMVILDSTIDTLEDYKKFEKKVFLFSFLIVIFASFIGAYKFYSISTGHITKSFYTYQGELIAGTSLWSDYTVFASALTLGVISGKYLFDISNKRLIKILIVVLQVFIMLVIFFSYSRRGVLFIILLLIMIVAFSFNRRKIKKVNIKNFAYLLIPLIILVFLFVGKLTTILNNDTSQNVLARISTLDDMTELTSSRTIRIKYAIELISDFNWRQLALGDGFNYLEEYSDKFHTELGSDYPHNFLFSTFLYGGLLALLLVFFLIICTIRAFISRFSIFSGFTFWLVILLIFSLTSTNSWFSVNLNIILCLLPFLSFNKKMNVLLKPVTE